jgi:hypothetical protein
MTHWRSNTKSPFIFSFFTGATTLSVLASSIGPWRFRNSKQFRGGIVSPTPNPQPGGPGTTFRLAPAL